MRSSSRAFWQLCLAGSALATAGALQPAAAGTPHSFAHAYTSADAPQLAASSQSVVFDVYLPLRNLASAKALAARQQVKGSLDYHKWLTPAEFGAKFGPDRTTMATVARDLKAAGFTVRSDIRSVHVTGTAAMVKRAFGADLHRVNGTDHQSHLVAIDGLTLSPVLQAAGAHVLAFANRSIMMHPHSTVVSAKPSPDNHYGVDGPYWFNDLKQAYGYPAFNATVTVGTEQRQLNGQGTTISALMSSDMLDSDVKLMFQHEHYLRNAPGPIPLPVHEYLAGALPKVFTGAYAEASLDMQQEIGGAPGARVILYDIPDLSDTSVIAGYTAIDNLNESDVVSSSFGLCELYYTPAYNGGIDYTYIPLTEDELFLQGNMQGITFLASSGDGAGRECISIGYFFGADKANYVPGPSSPATDPNVTAVGGTNLVTTYQPGKEKSVYVTENAYSDPMYPDDPYGAGILVNGKYWGAGGGPSVLFAKPDYQTVHTVSTMRSTPDIGMQVGGCPIGAYTPCDGGNLAINGNGNTDRSAVLVYISGGLYGLIGTSVSSPEFASAVAILVEQQGRQGNLNPYLYQYSAQQQAGTAAAAGFHANIPGWNSVHPNSYPAPGYNYTTGLGTPFVATLMQVPAGTPLAGSPRSPSNP